MPTLGDDVLTRLLHEQTDVLLAAVGRLSDDEVAARSGLPGWTRGHVLTHLSRNADGLARVLRSAMTGEVTPMYASAAARDADIEAGAARDASEQARRPAARLRGASPGCSPRCRTTCSTSRCPTAAASGCGCARSPGCG
ncbi:hypothetical protein GCM10025868_02720 [Angustibacter aerolatus]|uniref:Mycothiol-dependent maleylpyruvate isomerase metal-binding domain-containing protein n=1 Tax=Angustibacter aerolatus TaxID=1162965 RepID=A0ABQ6JDN7_9ACTN|nr:maleylpyruvate isomerase N-terminal domain-containing protein [Angustibacter aerolatus]GMA85022.1 hypothetical protein GCM10025868_02720 [Angustibacter aerolatus]